MVDALATAQGGENLLLLDVTLGPDEEQDRLADDLGGSVTEHALGGRVEGPDPTVQVLAEDGVVLDRPRFLHTPAGMTHFLRHLAGLLLFLACGCAAPAVDGAAVGVVPSAGRPSRGPTGLAGPGRAAVRDLVARINRRRVAIGCGALAWDDRLASVAERHSLDMARRAFFSHVNPDGEDPFDRMRRAGIRFRAAAENIAAGQRSGAETFGAWMGSRGHRRNLEDCVYTRIGIGLHRGHWTCLLARPAGGGPTERSPARG